MVKDLWSEVFTPEQLEIIETIKPGDTLDNLKLLLKFLMAKLWKELEKERLDSESSSEATKLIDLGRRLNEDISDLQGGSEGDPENILDQLLDERKKRDMVGTD